MSEPVLLDLFCKAGGASKGYADAGFRVIGLDIEPQPKYPYEFHQADAIAYLDGMIRFGFRGINAAHASPPCQAFSIVSDCVPGTKKRYPDLIEPVRSRFKRLGIPWIIENVPGSPLIDPVVLCGSMFNLTYRNELQVRRHRLFETSFPLKAPCKCDHTLSALNPYGNTARKQFKERYGIEMRPKVFQDVMKVPWMTHNLATEAIPPAYTEYIGTQLLSYLNRKEAA